MTLNGNVVHLGEVKPNEHLARNLVGGGSKKSVKRLYDIDSRQIKPSQFFDSRTPMRLSVNRISTLKIEEAHKLGLQFKDEVNRGNPNQKRKIYHGFGQIDVFTCLIAGCIRVEKDDYGGTKPYHANVIYPNKEKHEIMKISLLLSYKAKLVKYQS